MCGVITSSWSSAHDSQQPGYSLITVEAMQKVVRSTCREAFLGGNCASTSQRYTLSGTSLLVKTHKCCQHYIRTTSEKKQLSSHQLFLSMAPGASGPAVQKHTHAYTSTSILSADMQPYIHMYFTQQATLPVGRENLPIDGSDWLEYLNVYVVTNTVYAIFMSGPGIAFVPKELL